MSEKKHQHSSLSETLDCEDCIGAVASSLPLDYVQRYGIARAAQPAGTTDDDGSTCFTFDERTQVLRYLAMNAQGMHWPINWDAEIVKRVLEKIQPAIGLTGSEGTQRAMDVELYANHKNAQDIAHKYGLDPSEESFAKAVGAILYVTNLGLAVRDAWRKRADAAEAKLAEHGIVWEEGKGYVFNGKE